MADDNRWGIGFEAGYDAAIEAIAKFVETGFEKDDLKMEIHQGHLDRIAAEIRALRATEEGDLTK